MATIMSGLRTLELEEKVKRAAEQRARDDRRRRWIGWLVAFGLMVAGLLGWWYWSSDEPASPLKAAPTENEDRSLVAPPENDTISEKELEPTKPSAPDVAPAKEPAPQKTDPPHSPKPETEPLKLEPAPAPEPSKGEVYASIPVSPDPEPPAEELALPEYPAPVNALRGGPEPDADDNPLDQVWYVNYPLNDLEAGEAFPVIDSLLRNRNFTRAFITISRAERSVVDSDTLAYLKGYTMLQLGRGPEAVAALESITVPPTGWEREMTWLRALGHCLADDRDAALALLQELTVSEEGLYQREAAKALELLKE